MAEVTSPGRSLEAGRGADRAAASPGRFGEALERARREGLAQAGVRLRGEAADRCARPAAEVARGAAQLRARPRDLTPEVGEGKAAGPASPPGAAGAGQQPQPPSAEVQEVQALRAAVRGLPAAVAAHPGSLALTFGSALTVDLRAGAQGLELTLRPAPALERAAQAELPGLVEALRARGLRVARADVRARSAPGRRPR